MTCPVACEWNPITGRETEYPRPEPWLHHHEHRQGDTDHSQEDGSDPASAMDHPEGPGLDSSDDS